MSELILICATVLICFLAGCYTAWKIVEYLTDAYVHIKCADFCDECESLRAQSVNKND